MSTGADNMRAARHGKTAALMACIASLGLMTTASRRGTQYEDAETEVSTAPTGEPPALRRRYTSDLCGAGLTHAPASPEALELLREERRARKAAAFAKRQPKGG